MCVCVCVCVCVFHEIIFYVTSLSKKHSMLAMCMYYLKAPAMHSKLRLHYVDTTRKILIINQKQGYKERFLTTANWSRGLLSQRLYKVPFVVLLDSRKFIICTSLLKVPGRPHFGACRWRVQSMLVPIHCSQI
jgi:hypothetical protein